MYKHPVCNPLRCFSCPLFLSVFSKPRGSHLVDAPCILSRKALTLGFLRVHCLSSSPLSPKFIIFRWTCSFSTRSFFRLLVLHPLWSHFPQCLILHTSLSRETDSENSSSLLSHVVHGLFVRVFSATRELLSSHLTPKTPTGSPPQTHVRKRRPARPLPGSFPGAGKLDLQELREGVGWSSQWTGERHVVWEEVLFLYVVKQVRTLWGTEQGAHGLLGNIP